MTCVIHCYAVLAIVSNSYPPLQGRLPTRYSPVRNSSKKSKLLSSAFYLHVLGTPPALILSQDRTLKKLIQVHLNYRSGFKTQLVLLTFCVSEFYSVFKEQILRWPLTASTSIDYQLLLLLSMFFYFFCHFFEYFSYKDNFRDRKKERNKKTGEWLPFPERSILASTVLNFWVRNGIRWNHCD